MNGEAAGDGLFDAVHGIGEGWTVEMPGDLRLWMGFHARGTAASDPEAFRWFASTPLRPSGPKTTPVPGVSQALLWSELTAMQSEPNRDRQLAQLIFDRANVPGGVDSESVILNITPDPEVQISGVHRPFELGRPLANYTQIRYQRDPFYGTVEPIAALPPRRFMRVTWPTIVFAFASRNPDIGLRRVEIDVPSAAMVVGALGVVWLIAWLAFGGMRRRRLVIRARRGECLACGYPLGVRTRTSP